MADYNNDHMKKEELNDTFEKALTGLNYLRIFKSMV